MGVYTIKKAIIGRENEINSFFDFSTNRINSAVFPSSLRALSRGIITPVKAVKMAIIILKIFEAIE